MSAGFFARLPIPRKLVAMIMVTASTVLLLAGAGVLLGSYVQTRNAVVQSLSTQARAVLENAVVSMQFFAKDRALETFHSLYLNPNLHLICLYSADGTLFVESRLRTGLGPCDAKNAEEGARFSLNALALTVAHRTDSGASSGWLTLHSNVAMIWEPLRMQAFVVLALLLVALGVALLVSARLQGLVSRPIMALAATAAEVSSRGDYSLRAARTTEDELGTLVDAFNRMLERIQQREADLSRANEELRREVAERQRAEQERAELLVREREANRLKDEFLATLSHELRTPLNAILGWTKLLRASAVPPAALDRALEKVERNAQIQSRLIEDLLEVSRIVSGKLRLDVREVDLVAIVNRAVDSIRPAAEARGVAIERRTTDDAIVTAGDPDRLQQVVWNLLSNAVKFTPAGGSVTIALAREALFDEINICDTGVGIDPAFLPHVFDSFRQADASSTRSHGGLGLGLSIVRHLTEMHGGAVEAWSDGAGRGARFTVRLPIRTVAPVAGTSDDLAPPATHSPGLLGSRILVVDDDGDTRELLVSVLESAGARVHAAASAGEAFTTAVEVEPDVLISDIAMPGQDGLALIRQIDGAMGPRAPRVRIAVTAFAGQRERQQTEAAGFNRHVVKPFDPVAFVRLVEELLAGPVAS